MGGTIDSPAGRCPACGRVFGTVVKSGPPCPVCGSGRHRVSFNDVVIEPTPETWPALREAISIIDGKHKRMEAAEEALGLRGRDAAAVGIGYLKQAIRRLLERNETPTLDAVLAWLADDGRLIGRRTAQDVSRPGPASSGTDHRDGTTT